MSRYKVRHMTQQNLRYIWDHMREYDREELSLQGYNAEVVMRHLEAPLSFCGLKGGKPFIAFGAGVYGICVFVWLFGTDELDRSWRTVHQIAKRFLSLVAAKYWGYSICVEVWEGHHQSRAWLRRLGFRDTPHRREVNNETLRIMEYRGQD